MLIKSSGGKAEHKAEWIFGGRDFFRPFSACTYLSQICPSSKIKWNVGGYGNGQDDP